LKIRPYARKMKYAILPILIIGLAPLLTQCQSSPDPVVVYKTIPPPEIDLPIFPDPEEFVDYDTESGNVLVKYDYWIRIAEYAIDVEAVREKYEAMRRIYENNDGL